MNCTQEVNIMINRFKEQRQKYGISIEKLSESSGISAQELSDIECEDFNIEELSAYKAARIAEALGCFLSELIYPDTL